MSDQSPPLPPVKKSRVLKVAHDITEPVPVVPEVADVPVPVVADVPVVPVPEVPEVSVPPVPVPDVPDFDREVEMWRGIELPSTVSKTEEKEDDVPPVVPVTKPHDMPPLEDCGEEDDMPPLIPVTKPHDMPPLEDCGEEDDMPPLDSGELDENNQADDEGESEQPQDEGDVEDEEPPRANEKKPQAEDDCQFMHDTNEIIEGEGESFSQKIYNALQSVNNVLIALAAGTAIGFILVSAFTNKSINNLNEL